MSARILASRWLSPARNRLTRRATMVPSYVVVGTKRGGSTSIADWITRHPDVAPCRAAKGTHYFDVNYQRGWAWFLSRFEPVSDRWSVTGEASPYYMFHPLAPQRIAAALPDARLVVSLREPVARAWSHYQSEVQKGFEDRPFDEAIALEASRLRGEEARMREHPAYESYAHRHHTYVQRGQYAEQLERLFSLFPREQVLVLRSEDVFADPAAELSKVWAHLGLRDVHLDGLPRHKATHEPMNIAPGLHARLVEHYRPWNERLVSLLGDDFSWNTDTVKD